MQRIQNARHIEMNNRDEFTRWKHYQLVDNKWKYHETYSEADNTNPGVSNDVNQTLESLESMMIDDGYKYIVRTIIEFTHIDGKSRFIREGSNWGEIGD